MRISDWSSDVCSSDLGLLGWATLRVGGVILRAFKDRMNQKRRMKMMKWPEHIKRMHEEEIELALKIDRLNEFINGTKFMSLSPLQQRLLEAQQSAMSSYLKILRIRSEERRVGKGCVSKC